jgi:hypothetical protein
MTVVAARRNDEVSRWPVLRVERYRHADVDAVDAELDAAGRDPGAGHRPHGGGGR